MEIQISEPITAYIKTIGDGFGFTVEQTAELLVEQMVELLQEADRYEESKRASEGGAA